MDISLYLAQMPGQPPAEHTAWLVCPFAPDFQLPEGGVPIFTDSTPYSGQSPEALPLSQLKDAPFVILDFQHRDPRRRDWIRQLRALLPCPVAAPPEEAEDGPVFLPPIPPDCIPSAAVKAWQGRPLFLDLSPQPVLLRLTKNGCQKSAAVIPKGICFEDQRLLCSYRLTSLQEDAAEFTLWRSQQQLLQLAEALHVAGVVALRQEWEGLPSPPPLPDSDR